MKKKYKLKKSAKIAFIILLVVIILIIFIIKKSSSKSYSLEYKIDDYDISENYNSKDKVYYYDITYNDLTYSFIYEAKLNKETKLIKDIDIYEDKDEDELCLVIDSDYIDANPLCSKDDEVIDYNLVSDSIKEDMGITNKEEKVIKTHDNYEIYNEADDLLLWSFKGFNHISNNDVKFIKLFNNDVYSIPITAVVGNYLMIADYEEKYNFSRVYVINLKNDKYDTWKLDYDISFDSYVLGVNDKSVYIMDQKNKIEYELVPEKKKMRVVASNNKKGIIYVDGKEEKISLDVLSSSRKNFTSYTNYHYSLKNNKLYLTYMDHDNKMRVSDHNVTSIISTHNDVVYYLVDDTLYSYSPSDGETKIIKYAEWAFNYENMIYVKY